MSSNRFGLEDLFHDNGVDLCLWGHEHTYERMWPVYDRKVYNGSYLEPYTNPGAPIHITSGSAVSSYLIMYSITLVFYILYKS